MAADWMLLLGGNELNAGFVQVARAWGVRLAVVDWNERPAIAGDRHIRLDIKSAGPIVAALRGFEGRIRFAYTSADVAVPSTAAINACLGLSPAPDAAIARACNKTAMNEAWSAAGLLGKRFAACTGAADVRRFALDLGRKLIVKPADSSSSRGITVVEADEIGAADWDHIFARAMQAGWRAGAAIAEEFVEGTEYTVEMVGDARGEVAAWGVSKKYHTVNTERNRIAVKLHYNPPDVPHERLERIADFAARCYRALGLRSALGHFEVIEAPDGRLEPVELAARSSGFIGTHLVSILGGAPGAYIAAARDVLGGASVCSGLVASPMSSMYFFYDPPPGVWRKDGAGLADYLPPAIASLAGDRERFRAGAVFGRIDCDNERYGYEVLAGPASMLTIERVRAAEAALYADAMEIGAAAGRRDPEPRRLPAAAARSSALA